jgi:hypothetical protein
MMVFNKSVDKTTFHPERRSIRQADKQTQGKQSAQVGSISVKVSFS